MFVEFLLSSAYNNKNSSNPDNCKVLKSLTKLTHHINRILDPDVYTIMCICV